MPFQKEGVHDQPEPPRVLLPEVEGNGHRLGQLHDEGNGVPVGIFLDLLYGLSRRFLLRRRVGPQASRAEVGVDGCLLHHRLRLDEALGGSDLRLSARRARPLQLAHNLVLGRLAPFQNLLRRRMVRPKLGHAVTKRKALGEQHVLRQVRLK